MHLKPSTQPPQAQSGQGQQELQVASGTASPEALGNVGDVCSERRVLQGLGARAMPVHGAVEARRSHRSTFDPLLYSNTATKRRPSHLWKEETILPREPR